MKKIISLLMSACIMISSFPIIVYASGNNSDQALENFSEQVVDIIRSDDEADSIEQETVKRVIVKSSKRINTFNAVETASGFKNYYILEFPDSYSAQKAVDYYNTLSYVSFAQLDSVITSSEISVNSATAPPANHLSYNSKTAGFDMLEEYMDDNNITYSERLTVAVIDTGVEHTHKYLKGRVEPTEYNYSNSGEENSAVDDAGHGTHVSGTIVDNTPDNVIIRPYKVLNSKGKGSTLAAIMAIEQAIADGADIINMSLSAEGFDEGMHEAVKEAYSKNIPVVVSSGNDGANLDKIQYSPASFEECITVKAATANYEYMGISSYSNYGSVCDIAAPGDHVYSCFIRGLYRYMDGTSMAAPLVTAAAAYLLLEYKDITAAEVEKRLKDYSIPFNVTSSGVPDSSDNQGGLYAEYITREMDFKLSEPVFSRESGDFETTFELKLSSDAESNIYYYFNNQPQYQFLYNEETPLIIKYGTTISAYCYKKGYKKSDVVTYVYNKIFTGDESDFEVDANGVIIEYYNDEETVVIPQELNGITITGIGNSAFKNKSLKTVTVPNTVTKIGQEAFLGCSSLELVCADNISELDVRAFSGCSSLTYFDISKLKEIPANAFENCKALTSIDFSDVQKINSGAFIGCVNLFSCISNSIKEIGSNAFKNSGIGYVNLTELQKLEQYAFDGCANLERAYLPKLSLIKKYAFNNCSNLKEVDFENATQVYSYAFNGCKSIEKFYFPNLTSIISSEKYHFANCTSLKEFEAPKLTCLGQNCFYNCTELKTLMLPELDRIGTSSFAENSFVEYLYAPKMTTAYSLPTAENAIVITSELFKFCIYQPGPTLIISGEKGTFAQEYANKHKIEFIDIDALGGSIRITEPGLRLGFSLYHTLDNEYQEYGFVYTAGNADEEQLKIENVDNKSVFKLVANNRINHDDGTTTYNLVFTGIPKSSYNMSVSARAYVKINGRYLYSDVNTRSFMEVANAVLENKYTSDDIRNSIEQLLNM